MHALGLDAQTWRMSRKVASKASTSSLIYETHHTYDGTFIPSARTSLTLCLLITNARQVRGNFGVLSEFLPDPAQGFSASNTTQGTERTLLASFPRLQLVHRSLGFFGDVSCAA